MPKQQQQPMQPLEFDADGIIRFRKNEIVRRLLDENGSIDLNRIALWDVSPEDRQQFAQLIGYSVSGFGDLSYASPETVRLADEQARTLIAGPTSDSIDKLVIDRGRWGRGSSGGLLVNPETSKMCCLGFLGEACGLARGSMLGVATPAFCKGQLKLWPERVLVDVENTWGNSTWTQGATDINDTVEMSEAEREEQLVEHFKEIGIELTFEG